MDIRLINAFCAVYEERSINKAAQRLNIAQPSISIAVRNLETDLHTQLFERSPSGTVPTAKAHVLYTRLQRVLAELDAAKRSVSSDFKDVRGPLRVGLPPVVTRNLLPELLPRFLEDYPDVSLRIAEGLPGRLLDMTLTGDVDFAVVATAPVDERIVARRIAAEPIVLISSREHGIIPPGRVTLETLPPLKLALPWAPYSIRSILDRYISSEELPIARTVDLDTIYMVLDLVRQTDWVTLFSISGLDLHRDDLRAHEIAGPPMTAEYFLVRPARTVMPAAGLIFAEALERAFAKVLVDWQALPKE